MKFKKKNFMIFISFGFLFFCLIITWLGFGDRGFKYLYGKGKERQSYLKRIHKLEKENQKLLEEIDRLHTDEKYLESVARRELGLIKDDEILYRFTREKEDNNSANPVKNKNQ